MTDLDERRLENPYSPATSNGFHLLGPPNPSPRIQAQSYGSSGTWIHYPDLQTVPTSSPRASPGPTSRDTVGSFVTGGWPESPPRQYSPPPDAIRLVSPLRLPPEARENVQTEGSGDNAAQEAYEIDDVVVVPAEGQDKSGMDRFVGGFIAGLKRLPRSIWRGRRPTVNDQPGFCVPQPESVLPTGMLQSADVPAEHYVPLPLSRHPSQLPTEQAMLQAGGVVSGADTAAMEQSNIFGPNHILTDAPPALPPDVASPNFRPTSDYEKMLTPRSSATPSITSYLTRVHRFLKELSRLPWVAPSTGRIAADYFPEENPRSRYISQRRRDRVSNKRWYRSRRRDIDLLGDEPGMSRRSARTTRTTFDGTIDSNTRHRLHSSHRPHHSHTRRSADAPQSDSNRRPRHRQRASGHSLPHSHTRSYNSSSHHSQSQGQLLQPSGYVYSPFLPSPLYLSPYPASATVRPETQPQGQVSPVQSLQPSLPMPLYVVQGVPPMEFMLSSPK
ncbi:hypothetical protein NEOLEDRAFT_1182217 [Neolentinus lepideus HHB14362 ss-1]|uniref:Uncharacterized protein n=1 Tax=Neolentinus lepideus HHB14362 ss-1 TaxID=1314782 RepID=A0A165PDZ2_9AGAM|nr:hypothetical protein NEOLEDRAFT_1182217 [Neolentinus lepideus HHB14362 ss-1]